MKSKTKNINGQEYETASEIEFDNNNKQFKEFRSLARNIDKVLSKFNVDGMNITLPVEKNVNVFIEVTKIYINDDGKRLKREVQ